jgi:hypothetical protein
MALKTIVVLICEVYNVMLWGDLCSKEGKAVQALCSRVLNHYLCSLCWCDIQGPHGLYDPRKAELVDCRLPVCSHVQSGSSYSCNAGGVNQCDYDVEYADGSSTMGVLMQDFITLMLINGTRTQRKAVLGCGYDQQGALAQSPASTDGVLGLSNSKVALSSQLAEQGIINNVIGHCLAGGSNGGGYLFFGDELVPSWGMTWAPLLGRPAM